MTQPQFDIQIDTRGLNEAIKATSTLQGPFTGIVINDGLRAIGRTFVPSKGTGPLADATPKKTGALAKSTFFEILANRLVTVGIKEQVLQILQPARTPPKYDSKAYGKFVREGTKPHIIRPRYAKALHWMVGEQDFFASQVHHPGTKANPYHTIVATALRFQVQNIVNRMTQRLISQYRRS
jgi:hypothetical protein